MSRMDTTSSNWEVTRHVVLERDGYRCVSCGVDLISESADIHHLLPRSMGGSDDLSNLVSLCDGCHASHHPNLSGSLARRVLERWAVRLAQWLDHENIIPESARDFGSTLRLFGLQRFRAGQLPIVMAALTGKSVLVVSPTGSGKTLCFQLPAVLRRDISIVVSPLKTLMSEQVSELLIKKIPASYINSDLSRDEKQIRYSLLAQNALKLLYVAPERFFVRNPRERNRLKSSKPAFLVVDEAHCVDQWGRDFRPEYGRLREVRESLGSPPVLAFTATAGLEMQQRILASMGVKDAKVFVRDVDRPNITLLRRRCVPDNRAKEIAQLLKVKMLNGQKAMVFVPSTRVGEKLRSDLANFGHEIPLYHSQLGTAWERQELVKRFTGQSRPVVDQMICTSAFGMGLDIPNVRLVVHWQPPASMEDLLQELGRAGRDGKPAVSLTYHDDMTSDGDVHRLRFMAEKTVETAQLDEADRAKLLKDRLKKIDIVAASFQSKTCFRKTICEYFESSAAQNSLSISAHILDWLFGAKHRKQQPLACCDICDVKHLKKHGMLAFAAWIIMKGASQNKK